MLAVEYWQRAQLAARMTLNFVRYSNDFIRFTGEHFVTHRQAFSQ